MAANWTCPQYGLGSKRGMLQLVLRLSEGPDGPGSQAMGDLGACRLLLERRAASLRERKEVKNEGKKPGGRLFSGKARRRSITRMSAFDLASFNWLS